MKEYVITLIEASDFPGMIAVIFKDRPEWQKGRINLPGGKIEFNRAPFETAIVETEEETGIRITTPNIELMGQLIGTWGVVYCFKGKTEYVAELKPRECETEQAAWYSWDSLKDDPRLIPNLKVIIPLMRSGVKGWVVADEGYSTMGQPHQIAVTV